MSDRVSRWRLVFFFLVMASAVAIHARAQSPLTPDASPGARLLDGFENPSSWKVVTADGVSLRVGAERGRTGMCARLDYDFSRGSGYAIIRKPFDFPLPINYRFSYFIKGAGPRNTVEFKLVDPSGDNVWWANQRDFEFPREWSRITLPQRKIGFAWGPAGAAKRLENVGFIEIVITSFNGGHGTVWLDDLSFEPLPAVVPYMGIPSLRDTGTSAETVGAHAIGPDGATSWSSTARDSEPSFRVDFGQVREIGGMVITWGRQHASDYDVLSSSDGNHFVEVASVRGSNGGRDYVQMPDTTARALMVRVLKASAPSGVSVTNLRFMDNAFGDSTNDMLITAAADAPRGWWPRYLRGEAAYWTVVGADADDKEALVGEDGAIEVDKLGFSLEPFVFEDGRLHTWNDGAGVQTLERGCLPIPSVVRTDHDFELETKAFTQGLVGKSSLVVQYTLRNTGDRRLSGSMFIAIRPLQVNPVYQNLNITGGAAAVRRIAKEGDGVHVDDRLVVPVEEPARFGATTFDGGEIVEHLATGHLPLLQTIDDPRGLGSAALQYAFDLAPHQSRAVGIVVPFHEPVSPLSGPISELRAHAFLRESLDSAIASWTDRVGRVTLHVPKEERLIADSVRANLGYILVNRDGPGLQPGSRCYERTWIRDGALTSDALLSMGLSEDVRSFLDWFAPFQYDNGKIPCCVDRRGPDPVPENDSHGEYISAVRAYYAYTRDAEFVRRHWPRVLKAAEYIETLRKQRMTEEYENGPPDKRVLYGLMPESISHEGYSAKPMHSYWDDFWTLKGLADAAALADVMGDRVQGSRLRSLHDSFNTTLTDSIRLAMRLRRVEFMPGCAELGDFDATSTTVALFPCGWEPGELEDALDHTFDRYWGFFKDRRDGRIAWTAYTPYEERIVGSMVLLGHRDRALEMLDFFFKDQRPAGWRQWAEVVRRDPREPGYIGDMPHTWVGSDYINSVRLMFAYTRAVDDALILGAGLPRSWLESVDGVGVEGLFTEYGRLTFDVHKDKGGDTIRFEIHGLEHPPRGGVWVALPDAGELATIAIGGVQRPVPADGLVRVGDIPANLVVRYRSDPASPTRDP